MVQVALKCPTELYGASQSPRGPALLADSRASCRRYCARRLHAPAGVARRKRLQPKDDGGGARSRCSTGADSGDGVATAFDACLGRLNECVAVAEAGSPECMPDVAGESRC